MGGMKDEGIHYLLANRRRRNLIKYLMNNGGEGSLKDILAYMSELEGCTTSKGRKSIYVSLIQTHIPKLERSGVIKMDSNGNVVLLHTSPDMKLYLEAVESGNIPWSYYYLGLSSIMLLSSLFLGEMWAIVVSSIFFMSSAAHSVIQARTTSSFLEKM
jgi:hypothetical protein